MNIFPAIDIIEGKCVRLTKGVLSNKTIYENSPVEMAKIYQRLSDRFNSLKENFEKNKDPKIVYSNGGITKVQNYVKLYRSSFYCLGDE